MQAINNLNNRISLLTIQKSAALSTYEASEAEYNMVQKQIDMLAIDVYNLKVMFETGGATAYDYTVKQNELEKAAEEEEEEGELAGLYHQMMSALEETDQYTQSIENEKKDYRKTLLNLIVQKEKEMLEAEGTMIKSKNITRMYTLEAPVSGRVNGLGDNAIGSVVSVTTPIMTIVPRDTPMIVEARIANMDIGFIEGTITFISPDAYQDEGSGSYYKIKVKRDSETIQINGKEMRISSGMTTTVEIKTGKRRIIEFFLPAIDYIKESFELR